MATFLTAVDAVVPSREERPVLLAAVLADKDVEGLVALLADAFPRVAVTQTSSPRALPADELAARFAGEFGPSVVAGEHNIDLSAALGATLLQAGVPAGSVAWCADSTASATGRFFSYRAEGGVCGRHGALAVLGGSSAGWVPRGEGDADACRGEERAL